MNDASKPQVETAQAQVISNPFTETTSHNKPSAVAPVANSTLQATVASNDSPTSPSFAADNDLIEKTWITAVDKMAREYGDDPFVLQQKQAELTRDYLKKRFGREIKSS